MSNSSKTDKNPNGKLSIFFCGGVDSVTGANFILQGADSNGVMRKIGFDCGMRAIYLAKKGSYDAARVVGLISSVRQYGSLHLNGFNTVNRTTLDYFWQDFRGIRMERMKRRMFDAYRRRSWFYPPHKRRPFVLNAEELATIYHFPGQVAATPTLQKIESKKGEPPFDLPV